jgi:hypothetical protein
MIIMVIMVIMIIMGSPWIPHSFPIISRLFPYDFRIMSLLLVPHHFHFPIISLLFSHDFPINSHGSSGPVVCFFGSVSI